MSMRLSRRRPKAPRDCTASGKEGPSAGTAHRPGGSICRSAGRSWLPSSIRSPLRRCLRPAGHSGPATSLRIMAGCCRVRRPIWPCRCDFRRSHGGRHRRTKFTFMACSAAEAAWGSRPPLGVMLDAQSLRRPLMRSSSGCLRAGRRNKLPTKRHVGRCGACMQNCVRCPAPRPG